MRSFSNLWFWIVLAVLWSSTSYWVLGVPFEMIQQARREGGKVQQDVEDLVRINTSRLLMMVERSGVIGVALLSFWGTGLALLAFYYDVEFAQALFLLLAPLTVVVWQSVRASRRIAAEGLRGRRTTGATRRIRYRPEPTGSTRGHPADAVRGAQ